MRRIGGILCAVVVLGLVVAGRAAAVDPPSAYRSTVVLFKGDTYTEKGPAATPGGGDGNTYAPEIRKEGSLWRMWYGGQGVDGREHIHYAESSDGWNWDRKGVVLTHPDDPLIEDPSIVVVGGTYFMYYTVAHIGITDTIHLATSPDGITWTPQGRVLDQGPEGSWDDANVGRPSVLYEDGVFKLWYDGCKGLPGTDTVGPVLGESCASFRNVGYAESTDGYTFTKYAGNPILSPAEAVNVSRYRGVYVMLHENQQGTLIALSDDGLTWTERGTFIPLSGQSWDKYGQVTPFLYYGEDGKPARAYMGLAREACWCQNLMGGATVEATALDALIDGTGPPPTGPVPPTTLVSAIDYSDTFTAGFNGRVSDQAYPVGLRHGPDALKVENTGTNASQSWNEGKWSLADDATHAENEAWSGGSGRGSDTGIVQLGWSEGTGPGLPNDFGVAYGLRRDFVVQADAMAPANGTVAFTTASGRDSQGYGDGLTLRVRRPGTGAPQVGLYTPGVGEVDTGLTPGLGAGWHTYGVRFDLTRGRVTVDIDDVRLGTVDLATVGGGRLATTAYSHGAVSVGLDLGLPPAGTTPAGWVDNVLVGAPAASAYSDAPAPPPSVPELPWPALGLAATAAAGGAAVARRRRRAA